MCSLKLIFQYLCIYKTNFVILHFECCILHPLVAFTMATKPRGFGMTAEIQKKIAASFDPVKANQVFDWMRAILEQAGSESGKKLPNVSQVLL